jgi:hypothetical protein
MAKKNSTEEEVPVTDAAPKAFNPPGSQPPKPEITAQSLKKAVELVGKQPKELKKRKSAVPVQDVTVILGMQNREGNREEVIHDINTLEDLRIVSCAHTIEEKTRAVKEDGQLIGYEPTGEYILTLKVKYIKD